MDSPGKARFVAAIYDLLGEGDTAEKSAERIFELIETFSDHRRGEPRATAPRVQPRRPEGDA